LGYSLLTYSSDWAWRTAVTEGPRLVGAAGNLAAKSGQLALHGARAVTPFVTQAAREAFQAAIWSAQACLLIVGGFWEWAKFAYRRAGAQSDLRRMNCGQFVLVARGNEFDEVWLASPVPMYVGHHPGLEWVVRTTDDDVSRFEWAHVVMQAGQVMPCLGDGLQRRAPNGVGPNIINWLCDPVNANNLWAPEVQQAIALCSEARAVAEHCANTGGGTRTTAGTAEVMKFVRGAGLVPPGAVAPAAVQAPVLPLGAPAGPAQAMRGAVLDPGQAPIVGAPGGAGAVVAPAAAGALGFPAADEDMVSLMREIAAMKLALTSRSSSSSSGNRKSRKKDKKGGRKSSGSRDRNEKEKKKKKKKRHGSSSNSSSSSRSRSPLRWKPNGRNQPVTAEQLHKLSAQRFKNRGALLAFAAKHPGALTASFLAEVHRKCGLGEVRESKNLRKASVRTWATDKSGLTDLRDQREVSTLAAVTDHLQVDEVAMALDIICQRISAVQLAKQKGSTWERAEKSELIPIGSHLMAPPGVQQLTQ